MKLANAYIAGGKYWEGSSSLRQGGLGRVGAGKRAGASVGRLPRQGSSSNSSRWAQWAGSCWRREEEALRSAWRILEVSSHADPWAHLAMGIVAQWRPWDPWADLYRDSRRENTGTGLTLGVGRPLATVRGSAVGDRAGGARRNSDGIGAFRLLAWPAGPDMLRLLVPRALQKEIPTTTQLPICLLACLSACLPASLAQGSKGRRVKGQGSKGRRAKSLIQRRV